MDPGSACALGTIMRPVSRPVMTDCHVGRARAGYSLEQVKHDATALEDSVFLLTLA
jgi:hypothetical protein